MATTTLPTGYATVAELKAWARIDSNAEDAILQIMLDGALEAIQEALNRTIVLTATQDSAEVLYDNSLKTAHLMTAADYYKNRELTSAAAVSEIPTGAKAIIDKKRVWFGGKQ